MCGASALAGEERFDLIVLDLMLPCVGGLEVFRRLRRDGIQAPVIMLTAKSSESDRILGLETGADDYLTKPFNARELVLRMQSILRRMGPAEDQTVERQIVTDGGLCLDLIARKAFRAERGLDLTLREYDLLAHLVTHPADRPLVGVRLILKGSPRPNPGQASPRGPFQVEQEPLGGQPAKITTQPAITANDPVTRQDNRQRVGCAGRTDRAGGTRMPQRLGDLRISHGPPIADGPQETLHLAPKPGRGRPVEQKIEVASLTGEVLPDLPDGLAGGPAVVHQLHS